jgi:pyrimidine deaminase RibD-like protein
VPKKIQEPVVLLPTNKIDVFEPDAKFNNPKHAANLERIKAAILKGVKLPAILVRRVGQKYQVVDGHHRFKAYRNLNIKQIPARIVKSQNIAVVDKSPSPVDEAWSKKYKKSINCNNPKGFSQRAHCAGRKARSAHRKTKSTSVSEATTQSNTSHDMDQIATHYAELYDQILIILCDMIDYQSIHNPEKYGEVGAAIVDPDSRIVVGLSTASNGKWRHAEYTAIVAYNKKYGEIPPGSVIITTCSPCSARMPDRYGASCTHRINQQPIPLVYCGFEDPTQLTHLHNFKLVITQNTHIHDRCEIHAQRFMDWELEQQTQDHPDPHCRAAQKANR